MRVTSPPSARPFVSRMTKPTITPIGFMLPSRSFSTTSGFASSACWTIGSSGSPPPIAPRPPRSANRPGAAPPAARRDPVGVAALGEEAVEDLLGRVLRDLALGDHPDERRERAGLDARLGRVLDVDAGDELVAPVRQRLGLDAIRTERGLEVVAELGAPGEQLGAVGAQAEVALEPL